MDTHLLDLARALRDIQLSEEAVKRRKAEVARILILDGYVGLKGNNTCVCFACDQVGFMECTNNQNGCAPDGGCRPITNREE